MADSLQLRIVTPREQMLDQSVEEVTAPGTVGEFGVFPEHATFFSSLEIGRLSYRDTSGLHHLAIRAGFAEVADNVMTVLAEAAEASSDIDTAQARADLQAAEAKLEQLAPVDPAYDETDASRRWALARLQVAGN